MADPNKTLKPLAEPQSGRAPVFVSSNRLNEIIDSDPRIAASEDAQLNLVNQMIGEGYEIEGINAKFSFGDAGKEYGADIKEMAEGLAHMLMNPFQTAEGLGSVTRGLLRKVLPKPVADVALYPGAKLRQTLPEFLGGTDLTPEQQSEQENQALSIIGDAIVENAGSLDRVLNTIEKNPAEFVSTVATLGAGLGKTAATKGAQAGILSASQARNIIKTAEMVNRLNYVSDPISIATGAGKVAILGSLKLANKRLGVEHLLKDANVNEQMLQGMGLTGAQRVKLSDATKEAKVGEAVAQMGITGTLEEMSERAGKISEASGKTIDATLKRLDQPVPTNVAPTTRTPPEIDADILKRTEELEIAGASADDLANDPVLKQLDEESLAAYSQNAKPPKTELRSQTYKVDDADKALDQIYDMRKSGTEKLSDLVAPADQRIAKGLDLTDQETYRITNKTQTQAGDIGKRLVGMGVEAGDDYAAISEKLKSAAKQSQKTLDDALEGASKTRFSTELNKKILNNLKRLKKGIPFKDLAKPLQDEYNNIVKLLLRNENRGLNLSEINEVKRLIDNMAGDKVFTVAGDVKTSNIGKNLGTLRKELRSFIEKKAEQVGVPNVRELNNQTQFAQEVKSVVDKKIKSGQPKAPANKEAFTAPEFQALRDELLALRKKSVEQGLSLSELNRVDNLITEIGAKGKDKLNLDKLQSRIRSTIDEKAAERGANNLSKLRGQKQFTEEVKKVLDKKITAGGDKKTAQDLGRVVTQTVFGELLYRSKLGKVYGLLKGVRGLFQTIRAIQMLKDKDFAKLQGVDVPRTATKTETKFLKKAAREKAVNEYIEVMNKVLKDLSKMYPALRGIRLTGEALKAVKDEQGRIVMPATVVAGSAAEPAKGVTGEEFENAGSEVILPARR